jgi:hypothetical protein
MQMTKRVGSKVGLLLVGVAMVGAAGCRRRGDSDIDQIGNAIGEMMASLDESQGGTTTAMPSPALPMLRTPDELRGPMWRRAMDVVLPSAYAASCFDGSVMYSACSSGVRTKSWGSCAIGGATLDGTVTLTFNRDLCVVATAGDAVTRTADFTLTGAYGGTLAVTSPGGGQTLTKTATGWEYSVGGMQRVLTGPGGRKLFDVTTHTTAPIVGSGASRANLVITSGSLQIDHNLAEYSVTLTASNLTWASTCNCAVSGTLTGTVSGGRRDGKSASVTITGCGQADVTLDGETESVDLDRCGSI